MLVLASSSERRLQLLNRIGYNPDVVCAADIDESPLPNELPHALVHRLAVSKAELIAARFPDAIVLAADTIPYCRRQYFGKPLDATEAASHLRLLSGRRHRVYTGVCVIYQGKPRVRIAITTLKFKNLTAQEINDYVACGEWEGKSGGYSLQGKAAIFVQWLKGTDSNVLGLPLYDTHCLLQGCVPKIRS